LQPQSELQELQELHPPPVAVLYAAGRAVVWDA
jgi:hypothetical protein